VSEQGLDTYYAHSCAVDCDDVLNGSVALGLIQAVSAGLVEGAESIGDEAGDVVLASEGVVLEDLASSVSSNTFQWEQNIPCLVRCEHHHQ
jgi:hypothetical protein